MEDTSEENLVELLTLRKEVSAGGTTTYYNTDGDIHRIHGPAIIWDNGTAEWFMHGLRHRFGGPAIEYASGAKFWWENGIFIK